MVSPKDSSLLPTFYISSIAKKDGVKVLLSADGGDEFYFGYNSYFKYLKQLRYFFYLYPIIKFLSKVLNTNFLKGTRLYFLFNLARANLSLGEYVYNLMFVFKNVKSYNVLDKEYIPDVRTFKNIPNWRIPVLSDFENYLPNDILLKIDRATMYNSIEGREPLLDYDVFLIIKNFKIDQFYNSKLRGKVVLKNILNKLLPTYFDKKKKSGFSLDLPYLLKNSCNKILEYYFSEEALKKSNIYSFSLFKRITIVLNSSSIDNEESFFVYNLLVYQLWYYKNFDIDYYKQPSLIHSN